MRYCRNTPMTALFKNKRMCTFPKDSKHSQILSGLTMVGILSVWSIFNTIVVCFMVGRLGKKNNPEDPWLRTGFTGAAAGPQKTDQEWVPTCRRRMRCRKENSWPRSNTSPHHSPPLLKSDPFTHLYSSSHLPLALCLHFLSFILSGLPCFLLLFYFFLDNSL